MTTEQKWTPSLNEAVYVLQWRQFGFVKEHRADLHPPRWTVQISLDDTICVEQHLLKPASWCF